MECNLEVGQKVVYVNDKAVIPYQTGPEELVLGRIYTIRKVFMFKDYCGFNSVCVLVDEIRRPDRDEDGNPIDIPFYAWRFKPVKTTKTDISVFTQILDSIKKPDLIDA
jgi:hypothetical protein